MFGSAFGFALYYYMIKHAEAGHIALITLVTPVSALLLGHGLNDDAVLPQVWLGTGSIMLGLCTHRWGGQWLGYLPIIAKINNRNLRGQACKVASTSAGRGDYIPNSFSMSA